MTFEEDLAKADQKVHRVEDQWHHPIMVRYGFRPETATAVGFVRAYTYTDDVGRHFSCRTGVNADYWIDVSTDNQGYWRELEPYLKKKGYLERK